MNDSEAQKRESALKRLKNITFFTIFEMRFAKLQNIKKPLQNECFRAGGKVNKHLIKPMEDQCFEARKRKSART